jgi:hypothetical protein
VKYLADIIQDNNLLPEGVEFITRLTIEQSDIIFSTGFALFKIRCFPNSLRPKEMSFYSMYDLVPHTRRRVLRRI